MRRLNRDPFHVVFDGTAYVSITRKTIFARKPPAIIILLFFSAKLHCFAFSKTMLWLSYAGLLAPSLRKRLVSIITCAEEGRHVRIEPFAPQR